MIWRWKEQTDFFSVCPVVRGMSPSIGCLKLLSPSSHSAFIPVALSCMLNYMFMTDNFGEINCACDRSGGGLGTGVLVVCICHEMGKGVLVVCIRHEMGNPHKKSC